MKEQIIYRYNNTITAMLNRLIRLRDFKRARITKESDEKIYINLFKELLKLRNELNYIKFNN